MLRCAAIYELESQSPSEASHLLMCLYLQKLPYYKLCESSARMSHNIVVGRRIDNSHTDIPSVLGAPYFMSVPFLYEQYHVMII